MATSLLPTTRPMAGRGLVQNEYVVSQKPVGAAAWSMPEKTAPRVPFAERHGASSSCARASLAPSCAACVPPTKLGSLCPFLSVVFLRDAHFRRTRAPRKAPAVAERGPNRVTGGRRASRAGQTDLRSQSLRFVASACVRIHIYIYIYVYIYIYIYIYMCFDNTYTDTDTDHTDTDTDTHAHNNDNNKTTNTNTASAIVSSPASSPETKGRLARGTRPPD